MVDEQAFRYETEKMDFVFTFSADFIEYVDKEKTYKLKWYLIKPYIVFRNNIFLTLKSSDTSTFTVNKDEIGEKDFLEICAILNEKIGKSKSFN